MTVYRTFTLKYSEMKKLLMLSVCLVMTLSMSAQFPGFGGKKKPTIKGVIKGSLKDSATKEGLAYASVSLSKAGSEIILDGVLTDEDGDFKFENVVNGAYDILATYIGYTEVRLDSVETTLKRPDKDLGAIMMTVGTQIIEGVEIKAEKSLVENKVDRIVFNAENDASIAGGDATDVLRKVPMLNVDLDGNVSLRGSNNVQILINGKPSGMFASNKNEALKMFPADQIKKVEVITSPGAKYDGEGSAGVINIVTKGKNVEGIAGSINASVSNRQNNAFVNLNAGKGRFGFSSNGGVFYMLPQTAENSFSRIAGDIVAKNTGQTETARLGFNGSASAFYDFNAYNSINTRFSGRGFGFDMEGKVDGFLDDPGRSFYDKYARTNTTSNLNSGYDWSTDYTRKFARDEAQELVLAFQYSGNVQDQKYDLQELHDDASLSRFENVLNDGNNGEWTGQIDFTYPVNKSIKIETGAKGVLRDIISDYDYKIKKENNFVSDPLRTNVFDYDQNVMAGYLSGTFSLGKGVSMITGLRYERTDIAGKFDKDNSDRTSPFKNDYETWLPNFTISKQLKGFKTLKLAYSRRLQRPSLFYINPFNNQLDLYNQVYGNPYVDPEITDQVELGYNFNVAGFTVFANTYFKYTDDIIESTLKVNDKGVSINTFDNVGVNRSVGLNLFTTKSIGNLTLRGGGDVYSYNAKGVVNGEDLAAKDVLFSLFFNGDYGFTKTFKADFFGFFQAAQRTLQGVNPSFSIMGIGLRKEFKDFSIGVRVIEPFRPTKSFNSDLSGAGFSQKTTFEIPFRSFGVNFRYKFGKVDFRERKSKVKNDDLKSGQNNNGNGGGQGSRGM